MRRAEEILTEAYDSDGWIEIAARLRARDPTLGDKLVMRAIEQAQREAVEEAADRFEAIVSRGYPRPGVNPLKNGEQCAHGRCEWEDCIGCYDEALYAQIEAVRALPHREGQ